MKPANPGMTQRTLGGLAWVAAGKGTTAAIDLVVVLVLARLLSPTDFGIVSAALVIVRFSSVFSRLGLGPALVQIARVEERHVRTAFTTSVTLGLTVGGIIWLSAPFVGRFFQIDGVPEVLRVLAWTFVLRGLGLTAESLALRDMRFSWLMRRDVACFALGYAPVGIGMALAGFGPWALVGAQLTQTGLRTLLLLIRFPPPRNWRIDRPALNELAYFGGGFTAGKIANYLALEGDYLVVGRWLGAASLGLYTRAYKVMSGPAALFGGMLDDVLFPAMARVQEEAGRLGVAYRRGVAVVALVMTPLSVLLAILAPDLVRVLLGPQWDQAIVPVQVLSLGMLFRTSYKIGDSLARATGAVYRRAWRQALYAAAVIGGAWIGQHWGITGVAVGVLGALAFNFLLTAQLSVTITGVSWRQFGAAHVPALLLAALTGAVTWALATWLRALEAHGLLVLLAGGAGALLAAGLAMRLMPRVVLGSDGIWMLDTLMSFLRRLRPRVPAATAEPAASP